jgi:hypothetical protein
MYMTLETVTRAIQLIVAPVVMVSACAILASGFLSRYAAINDRLRLMARDRIDLLQALNQGSGNAPGDLSSTRLKVIDVQIPILITHHWLVHNAIFALYLAIAIFLGDMVTIAASAFLSLDFFAYAALVIFLFGVASMLVSVVMAVREVRTSHRALYFELMQVRELAPTNP